MQPESNLLLMESTHMLMPQCGLDIYKTHDVHTHMYVHTDILKTDYKHNASDTHVHITKTQLLSNRISITIIILKICTPTFNK